MQYENRSAHCQSATRELPGRVWAAGLDRLLPPHCVLCGQPSAPARLCAHCRGQLIFAGLHCRRCGLPLANDIDSLCGRCVRRGPPFDLTVYPLQYRFPADRLVQSFKYNHQLAAGRALARLMCACIGSQDIPLPDALVPVPLHAWRLFRRGFNQSYELAAHVGKSLGIPLQTSGLRRGRHTLAQSGLDRRQRHRNVRGAFKWVTRQAPHHHVALVDDVMTTGTTVAECARVLKRAGAQRVDVWLAARAMRPA
jgi:ComF family protein